MATVTFILDKRTATDEYPLKMRITHGRGKTALVGTDLKLREDQWDGKQIINHKSADTLNDYIGAKRNKAEGIITRLQVNGMLDELSVTDLKKIIENNGVRPVQEDSKKGNFLNFFMECKESKNKCACNY